ncbi:MAG: hypothetical protein US67_C0014G0009 [Candidatus Woesebacteria bacterium GW2011_GWD1_38_10]|uniref:EfeO-type cupredoxin-like domain-containing protein n=3 Tax=Candidatus Woeseibacteriota TaxID=1752722 RepID=A0A0G0KUK6_9BACT|nr:MAG: hypothetical protein US67_C0014G0009 [Candidatus Woesebacteria bacterium GW2011_GWD1_38_10]KKQ83368.1 MAG: hypothetical protein UT06_C0023G0032 [Candidatus Woesebacteria bacterium GW2011_GWA1_38_8]
MTLDKIIVTSAGFILTGLIYWFFFGEKKEIIKGNGLVKILVSGGYKPDVIKLTKGISTTLIIKRTDPNSCLEDFILPDYKISKFLPLNKEVKITLLPGKTGVFGFHCGMNMYHGKIIVE